MGKSRLPLLCLALMSILMGILLLMLIMRPLTFDFQQPLFDTPVGEIRGDQTLGQSFRAEYPGLYRVDLLLATWARTNTEEVLFHLRKGAIDGQDLVTISFDGSSVEDDSYRSFLFPPLDNSSGENYWVILFSPHSRPGDAITAWYSTGDIYPEGERYEGGTPADGDLAFRLYYRPRLWDLATTPLQRLPDRKPSLLGTRWFYALLGVLYLSSAVGLLAGVALWPMSIFGFFALGHSRSSHRYRGEPEEDG